MEGVTLWYKESLNMKVVLSAALKTKKMKKITSPLFLVVIVTSLFFGCTPDNPPPNPPANNGVAVSWQATINGVSYNYSDT
ncbi:hypothetical protein LBMAG24_21650 [Bacteroidota bacterium]|nr:hypothetical protein LBMAG24_21650 [Bacteroidota bacterium]